MSKIDPKYPLIEDQYYYLLRCFDVWIRAKLAPSGDLRKMIDSTVKIDNPNYSTINRIESVVSQLIPDLWHSALMSRMLVEGKDPLSTPPPLKYAYPDYESVENE